MMNALTSKDRNYINVLFQFLFISFFVLSINSCTQKSATTWQSVIQSGKPINAIVMGNKWKQANDYFYCSGAGDNFNNMLYGDYFIKDSAFHVKIKMSLDTIAQTTCLFDFFSNHFGFDSDDKGNGEQEQLFMYSPEHDTLLYFGASAKAFQPKKPFVFEVIRSQETISIYIDQQLITEQPLSLFSAPLHGSVGIRPWRNQVKVYNWEISGALKLLPKIDHVFKNGEAGYACFRVPSIIQAENGNLLAFAEGRQNSCRDNYDVDAVLKISEDNGKTWGPVQTIWNDSSNTCAYPVPLVDRENGRVILLVGWQRGVDRVGAILNQKGVDIRRVFSFVSEDHGKTWSTRKEITDQVKLKDWDFITAGSGAGLQMVAPKYKNRLIAACHYSTMINGKPRVQSNLIYSDDGGLSWSVGGVAALGETNECEVTELEDGILMITMRVRNPVNPYRNIAFSYDGGLSIEDQRIDSLLYGPSCQASLDNYVDSKGQHIALFANPRHKSKRVNLVLQKSTDKGKSWQPIQTVFENYAGYSDLIVLKDGRIGCFFECGKIWSRDGIAFKTYDPVQLGL